jgi:SAM-dependent methyltransferase
MTGSSPQGLWSIARQGWRREVPDRYRRQSDAGPRGFHRRVADALDQGCVVLDLGAGAKPTVPPDARPGECVYVGLDISAAELRRAPAGSYDETVVVDAAAVPQPQLAGRFDLVVSLFALEHVENLEAVLANARTYLRPGGRMLAYLSGRYSPTSVVNRGLPSAAGAALVRRLNGRPPESIHPAHYDRCSYRQLSGLLADGWAASEVVACYWGEKYFRFSRPVHALYGVYEELVFRADRRQLATHYLIDATRA